MNPLPIFHSLPRTLRLAGLAGGALGFFCAAADLNAAVYNWAGATWTAGGPTAGNSANQNFNGIRANFINVAIQNNAPGSTTGAVWAGGYPTVNNTLTDGGTGANALQLYVNSQPSTTAYVGVTVKFADLVSATSFTLYDVDLRAGTWKDTISQIQAVTQTGQIIGVSGVTTSTTNSSTGTGLSTVVSGTADNNPSTGNGGNVTFTFNQPITQYSFRWSNTDPGLSTQLIGLGTINYTLVPEISPGWVTLGIAGLVLGSQLVRRRRRNAALPEAATVS